MRHRRKENSKGMNDNEAKRATIATRLKVARLQAGLSQGQVARLLDLHRPSISEVEAGRRKVSAEELAKLAQIYGVSATWLTGEEGSATTETDIRTEVAARELAKLKPEDLDRVLQLLATLRTTPQGKADE
jgi:transcriptional regulator with XRE-family HTH domain